MFHRSIILSCALLLARKVVAASPSQHGLDATFDYVIVGGGTAGLAIASRLAENPSLSVAVVEAGGFYEADNGNLSVVPGYCTAYSGTDPDLTNPKVDWGFVTTPQAVRRSRRLKPVLWCSGSHAVREQMVGACITPGAGPSEAHPLPISCITTDRPQGPLRNGHLIPVIRLMLFPTCCLTTKKVCSTPLQRSSTRTALFSRMLPCLRRMEVLCKYLSDATMILSPHGPYLRSKGLDKAPYRAFKAAI